MFTGIFIMVDSPRFPTSSRTDLKNALVYILQTEKKLLKTVLTIEVRLMHIYRAPFVSVFFSFGSKLNLMLHNVGWHETCFRNIYPIVRAYAN